MQNMIPAQPIELGSASRRNSRPWLHGVAGSFLSLVIAGLTGCEDSTGRLAVSGEITLDGAPLESGSILFTSIGAEQLISSGAMIQEGAYYVPQEQGLLPGTYQVEISSPDQSAPMTTAAVGPDQQGIPIARDRIPDEYNVNSDKRVEVTRDGDNTFDFDIVSKRGS